MAEMADGAGSPTGSASGMLRAVVDFAAKREGLSPGRAAEKETGKGDFSSGIMGSIAAWLRKRGKAVRPVLSKDQREELRECFNLIDADGSGAIDADELTEAFKVLGYHIKKREVEAMLAEVDRDGSGEVEYPEFVEIMTTKLSQMNDEVDDDEADTVKAQAARAKKKALPFQLLATAYRRKRMLDAVIYDENGMRAKLAQKAESQRQEEERLLAVGMSKRPSSKGNAFVAAMADARASPVRSRAGAISPQKVAERKRALNQFEYAGITGAEASRVVLPSIDRRESDSEANAARMRTIMPPSHVGAIAEIPTTNFETGDTETPYFIKSRAQRVGEALPAGMGRTAERAITVVEERAQRRHVNAKMRRVKRQGEHIHASFEYPEEIDGENAAVHHGVHPRYVAEHLTPLHARTPGTALLAEASSATFSTSPERPSMGHVLPEKRYKYVTRGTPASVSPLPPRAASSLGMTGGAHEGRYRASGGTRGRRQKGRDQLPGGPVASNMKLRVGARAQVRDLSLQGALRSQSSADNIGSDFQRTFLHDDMYGSPQHRRSSPSPLFF